MTRPYSVFRDEGVEPEPLPVSLRPVNVERERCRARRRGPVPTYYDLLMLVSEENRRRYVR